MFLGGDTGVVVHLVSISGGDKNQPVLNGIEVDEISEFLLSSTNNYTPRRLNSNKNLCFQGTNIHGTGFLLDAEKALELLKHNPNYNSRLKPCLNGNEVNNHPTQKPRDIALI